MSDRIVQFKPKKPKEEAEIEGVYNDARNAAEFVDVHHADVRFCWNRGAWFMFDGLWKRDCGAGMLTTAIKWTQDLLRQAADISHSKDRIAAVSRAAGLGNVAKLKSALELAKADPRVAVTEPQRWDANPMHLGVANGVVDLATGEFCQPQRDMMITRAAGTKYDAAAKCPKWEAFLARIVPDEEVRHFLKASAGLWLTGDMGEQIFWFFHGSGSNGKSTFLEVIFALLGDYSMRANSMLTVSPNGKDPTLELASLPGARVLIGSEVADGAKLNESIIKDITGGDTLSARALYRDFFSFKPTCKILMFGNHKPVIAGTDGGIWRRVRLVPFTQVIPPSERNPNLKAALMEELPGILNWALDGLAHWRQHGLPTPRVVTLATDSYREDSDPLGEFLEQCTNQEPQRTVQLSALYGRYEQWCRDTGHRGVLSDRRLRQRLEERGFPSIRGNAGRVIHGLSLIPTETPFE